MKLFELINGLKVLDKRGELNQEIKNLAFNVKDCFEGTLYFCYKGVTLDGHDFYEEAAKKGAVAFVVERFIDDCPFPQIKLNDVREALSKIAANFYGNAAKKLKIVGITGTNGKTSTTYIIESILHKNRKKVAVIGTNGIKIGKNFINSDLTTPDPIFLHKCFSDFVKNKIEYVVMEVSAHSIALKKIAGIDFEVCALTNITQDHLDFFETMENYSKSKLDFLKSCRKIVVNTDDPYGKKLFAGSFSSKISYAINAIACVRALNENMSIKGSKFDCQIFGKNYTVKSSLVGDFNVYNILCAISVCLMLKIPLKSIICGVKKVFIEGRFNVLPYKRNVVVDYAHTPDGLEKILQTARKVCNGKIITVFGCGGNRDRKKRPIMGEVVSRYSDVTIVTSDNPRFEVPIEIIKEIEEGLTTKEYKLIENRKEAIFYALKLCKKNDIVMICGKGAEKYQDIQGVKLPYSDYKVVKEFFK